MDEEFDLAGRVIGAAMKVHRTLGSGFLESVYQNALVFELKEAGFKVESEKPLTVKHRDFVVGTFAVDLLVEERLIVENKATQKLIAANEVQLVNYLSATGIDEGLLLNFGGTRLEYKKKFRLYLPKNPLPF